MDLNRIVAYSLRVGVLIGVFLSLVGLVYWGAGGFGNSAVSPDSDILGVVPSGFSGNVTGIVYIGVLVLIATPVFRVAISAIYFAFERDGRYVAITLIVLAMLLFALFSGAAI